MPVGTTPWRVSAPPARTCWPWPLPSWSRSQSSGATISSADPRPATDTGTDTEVVFHATGVGYTYLDRYPALDDVSFQIRAGERIALLGANGSGKSTLLKILDGLVFPTAGQLTAYGQPLTEESLADPEVNARFRSRVGIVFQNSDAQVFSATVREEIAFGCLQLGLSAVETAARTADVLAMLEIEDLVDRAPFQLSGGQKKKVALASVLVMNPDVILFDEPTAALDPRTQHWLIDLIAQLGRAGKTVVLATHDLHTLADLTDRAIIFGEDHRVLADTETTAILSDRSRLIAANLVHDHDV
jgi:cobalt/nickel transport system ATP-binding protein